jgi:NAD-dependent deacetylase
MDDGKLREQFSAWLAGRRVRRIVTLTGAGISAESGIPTFRGKDGLWRGKDPADLFMPDALAQSPQLAWEMYDELRTRIANAQPNAAHRALVELGRRRSLTLVTQNIDGLHQQAGSDGVLELHGNIWRLRCDVCRWREENRQVPLPALPPRCPGCGGVLRPDIVLFTESLPAAALSPAILAAEACDLMLVVGTSGVVYPAAALPGQAHARGAAVVEINPFPSALAGVVDFTVRATAAEALPWVVDIVAPDRG